MTITTMRSMVMRIIMTKRKMRDPITLIDNVILCHITLCHIMPCHIMQFKMRLSTSSLPQMLNTGNSIKMGTTCLTMKLNSRWSRIHYQHLTCTMLLTHATLMITSLTTDIACLKESSYERLSLTLTTSIRLSRSRSITSTSTSVITMCLIEAVRRAPTSRISLDTLMTAFLRAAKPILSSAV